MRKTIVYSAVLNSFVSLSVFAQGNGVQVPASSGSSTQQGSASAPAWINLVLIGGIILFMWLFVIRPQSKKTKEQKQFVDSLQSGMEVITSGGMIGTIIEVKDAIVTLNLGNTQVKILKSSISGKTETQK